MKIFHASVLIIRIFYKYKYLYSIEDISPSDVGPSDVGVSNVASSDVSVSNIEPSMMPPTLAHNESDDDTDTKLALQEDSMHVAAEGDKNGICQ